MNISIVVYYVILILEIINGFWCLYRAIKYSHFQKIKNEKIGKSNKEPNILIVIPCLREQNIIIKTIQYFLEIINDFDKVKLLIVTTQKEEYEKEKNLYLKEQFITDIKNNVDIQKLINSYNKILTTSDIRYILANRNNKKLEKIVDEKIKNSITTYELVKGYIDKHNLSDKLYIYNYPHNEGIMADQLNYVLNNFKFSDEKKYYFSVYNADSMPNRETIKEIIETVNEEDYPEVIQQYSVPTSNWNELPLLMKGFAIYQANFELRYGLINSHFPSKLLYTYVVGHGMYIRVDILKQIGGFETKYWCEDIYMSYVLRNKEITIKSIKSLETMQSPQYLSILTKQNAVWFKTSFECLKIFKDIFRKNRKINLGSLGWLIQRIRMNLTWLCLPLALLYTLIISIINKSHFMLGLSFFGYFTMILLEYGSTIKLIEYIQKSNFKNKMKVLLGAFLSTAISNIGPIYSLISRKKEKYKTVR